MDDNKPPPKPNNSFFSWVLAVLATAFVGMWAVAIVVGVTIGLLPLAPILIPIFLIHLFMKSSSKKPGDP